MSLQDLIGFIISFGLFILLMFRRASSGRQARREQSREESLETAEMKKKREDRELRAYLESLDLDPDDEELPPEIRPEIRPKMQHKKVRPPPPPVFKAASKPSLEPDSSYEVKNRDLPSRAERLMHELPHPKNLLVYYEIFGPPKSLRDDSR